MKTTPEDILTVCLTLALITYFAMHFQYWMDVWYLLKYDPFIVFNIWLEHGIRPGQG
jgi:hypothetical protein